MTVQSGVDIFKETCSLFFEPLYVTMQSSLEMLLLRDMVFLKALFGRPQICPSVEKMQVLYVKGAVKL